MHPTLLALLPVLVAMSVIYVWVVRYTAVLDDFATFQLPNWLRDVTGVSKLTGAALLLGAGRDLETTGAAIIAAFMLAAVIMHLRVKNPVSKMIPSIVLGIASAYLAWQ